MKKIAVDFEVMLKPEAGRTVSGSTTATPSAVLNGSRADSPDDNISGEAWRWRRGNLSGSLSRFSHHPYVGLPDAHDPLARFVHLRVGEVEN